MWGGLGKGRERHCVKKYVGWVCRQGVGFFDLWGGNCGWERWGNVVRWREAV